MVFFTVFWGVFWVLHMAGLPKNSKPYEWTIRGVVDDYRDKKKKKNQGDFFFVSAVVVISVLTEKFLLGVHSSL